MQNDAGEVVDMYIPRKCSSSGKIIGAKDHAAVQVCTFLLIIKSVTPILNITRYKIYFLKTFIYYSAEFFHLIQGSAGQKGTFFLCFKKHILK